MIDNRLYPCPCCGNKSISHLGNYEICPICNWEDDPIQSEDHDFSGGANSESLNEAREIYNSSLELDKKNLKSSR